MLFNVLHLYFCEITTNKGLINRIDVILYLINCDNSINEKEILSFSGSYHWLQADGNIISSFCLLDGFPPSLPPSLPLLSPPVSVPGALVAQETMAVYSAFWSAMHEATGCFLKGLMVTPSCNHLLVCPPRRPVSSRLVLPSLCSAVALIPSVPCSLFPWLPPSISRTPSISVGLSRSL